MPLFIRGLPFPLTGDLNLFFQRVAQRLETLFLYNEAGIVNAPHFGSKLESDSHQRFTFSPTETLDSQISRFFQPYSVETEIKRRLGEDPEVQAAEERFGETLRMGPRGLGTIPPETTATQEARRLYEETKKRHFPHYAREVALERLSVVESILRRLPAGSTALSSLISDLRKFLAEANVMLDIRGEPPLIVPMEEPLLQTEVLDRLLARLASSQPDRARELIQAYHGALQGDPPDSVFLQAFKTLEEIARSVTGDPKFVFDRKLLPKHFPKLDPAIRETIILLAGQRGDKAAHGRPALNRSEIRYLLFAICNLALLILDYPQ